MVVQYYADSLGLARPSHVRLHERYIDQFYRWLCENCEEKVFLIDRSRSALTIDKLVEIYKEDVEYIEQEKDILIIHEGVVDCAPRPVSPKVRNFISKLPPFAKYRIITFLHNKRAAILKRGWGSVMVDEKKYEAVFEDWLSKAVKTFKRIYIFNIAPTNPDIENHSPGFTKNILLYNSIIKNVIQRLSNQSIILLDVHSLISQAANIDEYIIKEDGHHITAKAHNLYASLLIENEKMRGKTNA